MDRIQSSVCGAKGATDRRILTGRFERECGWQMNNPNTRREQSAAQLDRIKMQALRVRWKSGRKKSECNPVEKSGWESDDGRARYSGLLCWRAKLRNWYSVMCDKAKQVIGKAECDQMPHVVAGRQRSNPKPADDWPIMASQRLTNWSTSRVTVVSTRSTRSDAKISWPITNMRDWNEQDRTISNDFFLTRIRNTIWL